MTILLIEDDAVEILKFNRSLVKLGVAHELIEAHNGEIAQEYEESLKQNRTSKKENFEEILTLMTNFINSF